MTASTLPRMAGATLPCGPRATASVTAALGARLAQPLRGARVNGGGWQVWINLWQRQAFVGRLDRPRAAVAADLVVVWQRRCVPDASVAARAAQRPFNVADGAYERDEALLAQLRRVRSAAAMKAWLEAVLCPGSGVPDGAPCAPSAPPPDALLLLADQAARCEQPPGAHPGASARAPMLARSRRKASRPRRAPTDALPACDDPPPKRPCRLRAACAGRLRCV